MNTINGSGNIAVLDSAVLADLCLGRFVVDILPSVWLGTGATKIKGVKVKVQTPSGIVVKDYANAYDIPTPASGNFTYPIPTQSGEYQYGDYTITVQLTDSNNSTYEDTKVVPLCRVGKTGNTGVLGAKLSASCKLGKLFVSLNTLPMYQGLVASSSVKNLTLNFPTASGQANQSSSVSAFTVSLFEGVYKLSGDVCATYGNTDNIKYKTKLLVSTEHDVKCVIDECAVFYKLAEIHQRLSDACSNAEREEAANITVDALRLYNTAKLGAECGEDVSLYLAELENLLGCRCTLGSDEGTPIIGTMTPSKDFNLTGCNVTKSVVGNTTTYNIENYEYVVEVGNNGGALTVSPATINGCVKTQRLSFNLEAVYAQIKQRAASSAEETDFWTSLIKINGTPLTTVIQNLTAQINSNTSGTTSCPATVATHSANQVQSSVRIAWSLTNASAVDIKVDGVYRATIPSSTTEYIIMGGADGRAHEYQLIPKCADGRAGTSVSAPYTFTYCPTIAAPTLNTSSVVGANCPYNLNNAIASIPAGTIQEWHYTNDTDAASKVATPTSVTGGTYYVFAKDASGCYSPSAQLVVTCATPTVCSAPVGMLVALINNGFRVQFQSATTPPPNNSYSVMRRLKAAPDADASYTLIGSPTFNSSTQRWEIVDTQALNNTVYVYKAVSNCSPTSKPYATYEFSNVIGQTCGIVQNLRVTM